MTDNLPAVRPPAEIAATDTDSWTRVVADVVKLASHVADTEFVPKGLRGSAPATAAAILYGREVGLPPMTALNMTYVVEGHPGISAEGMRALVLAAGHEIEFLESTGAVCTMRGRRRGSETWTSITWTLDMARAAGLLGKTNWKTYPRDMLVARCSTVLCRMLFPDVIHGFRSLEELEDMGSQDGDTQPAAAISAPAGKVSRRGGTRTASKGKATAEPRPAPPVLEGPPLPGEPGYDAPPSLAGTTDPDKVGVSDDGTESDDPDTRETREETPTDPTTEPVDVVDAETVPEATDTPDGPSDGDSDPGPRRITKPQQRMILAQCGNLGIEDRTVRLEACGVIVNHPVASSNDLTHAEASHVIDTLGRCRDYNALMTLLEEIERDRQEHPQ